MKEMESRVSWARFFVLIIALAISALLFFAAFEKIFSSNSLTTPLRTISPIAGYCEILIGALLLVYHPYGKVWALVGLMFSVWGGYALFWLVQGAPCSCMGKMVVFPPGVLFTLDALLFCIAAAIAHKSASKKIYRDFIAFSIYLFIIGFSSGIFINNYIIEK